MKRDSAFIQSELYKKDGKIYSKQKTILEFPKWYLDKDLASIQEVSYVYGIFALIIDDKYSVSTIPTLCSTVPVLVNEVERDGVLYIQFVYGKDDVVLDNVKVVKEELLSYNFFETYIVYAKIPWFVEPLDMVSIMNNLPKYGKSNVGANPIINELVVSFMTRSAKDKRVFYRQTTGKDEYAYVDLMNLYYAALSTTSKLGGSYFNKGLVSAIVQKEKEPSKLEIHSGM